MPNIFIKIIQDIWKSWKICIWYMYVCMYVCIFWGRYFLSLIIWLKNMVLISSRSLKSLYEDLWSPLIFKESKFLKIFIKILKRFLKVFGLFISVKKVNVFTISLKFFTKIFKNIFYFWRLFKISEDLWASSKYFQP